MSLKRVLIFIFLLCLSAVMVAGCGQTSDGGGSSSSGGGNSGGGNNSGSGGTLTDINFPNDPFSLLGKYKINSYSISPTGVRTSGDIIATAGSELRVNFDLSSFNILLGFIIKDFNQAYLKRKVTLTTIDLVKIAEIFTNLGAEVIDNKTLSFTMTSDNYPELVDKGMINEGETLFIHLTKIEDLSLSSGLGSDFEVQPDEPSQDGKPVISVEITDKPVNVTHGDTPFSLGKAVLPADADNTNVTYSSSHPANVEIDNEGNVTIKAYTDELITITMTSVANPDIKDFWSFNMQQAQITQINCDENISLTLKHSGDATYNLIPTVLPEIASSYVQFEYISENTEIATVSDTGIITAKKAGSTRIAVKAKNNSVTTYCNITVEDAPLISVPVTGITITGTTSKTIASGTSVTISYELTPSNTTEKEVKYTLSDGSEATTTANSTGQGTLTLTNETVTRDITLTAENNDTATFALTVVPLVILEFAHPVFAIDAGATGKQAPYGADVETAIQSIAYISSDTSIATVGADGTVTGIKNGVSKITATVYTKYSDTPMTAEYDADILDFIDFSTNDTFINTVEGTYDVEFFGTLPGKGTGLLGGQANVPVTNDCDKFKNIFNKSTCEGSGFVKNIILDSNSLAGRMTVSVSNIGEVTIITKMAMTNETMAGTAPNDQYQYTIYYPTNGADPLNANNTVKGIKGRHLEAKAPYLTSTFKIMQDTSDTTPTKKIRVDLKMFGKDLGGGKWGIGIVNPDTKVIAKKISSKSTRMEPNNINDAPFSKLKDKITVNASGDLSEEDFSF